MTWWVTATFMQITLSATALEPSGKWATDFASPGCVATRPFNNGQAQLSVAAPPLERKLIISANVASPVKLPRGTTLALVIGPSGRRFEGKAIDFNSPIAKSPEFGLYIDRDEIAQQAIADISFEHGKERLATFKTGAWNALLKSMSECAQDFIVSYGIDPERERQVETPAVPKLVDKLLRDSKISYDAISQRAQGKMGLRVLIGTTGHIEQCTPVTSSGSRTIDERACKLLVEQGRYTPAKDRSNTAIVSEQVIFNRWLPAVD